MKTSTIPLKIKTRDGHFSMDFYFFLSFKKTHQVYGGGVKKNYNYFHVFYNLQLGYMLKAMQLSVICLLTLSKEITYLELFNTFLITQAKSPK